MDTAQIQGQVNLNIYFDLVAFSLLFYDFFLTSDVEISRYWDSPRKFGTILFFSNHYVALFGNIPVVIQTLWTTPSSPEKIMVCQHLEKYHQYFIVVTQVLVGLILLVRTYALYHGSNRVLTFMIFSAIAALSIGIWSTLTGEAGRSENLERYIGCVFGTTKAQGVSLAIAWAGSGFFDFTIFLLTMYKGLAESRPRGVNFLTLFLRDGLVYFGVMSLCNLSNILVFVLGGPYTRGIPTTFTNIISSLSVSRLMLNLRDPSLLQATSGEAVSERSRVATGFIFIPYRGALEMHTDASRDVELPDRKDRVVQALRSTEPVY
ncbi:hypothetical protein K438DRAFT_1682430 [Mycena galopus ATCC 62051]|nr:hypothetical protein K438DRAFT_1689891 [Mycena galopus ATCC 62051]KAF8175469.1 hypothetical protein K438DRAFT_1682430 [Mycena galopus ATCC 62051]